MINIINENDLKSYTNLNKIYIPNDYINESYSYYFNGDYINIITNNDCYTQYNSTYCSCYQYNRENNVVSESYSCNISSNLPKISNESITNDINYSNSLKTAYLGNTGIYLLMFVVALLFASLLLKERKHL